MDKIAKKNQVVNIRGISSPFAKQFPIKLFKKYNYVSEPRLTFIIDLNQDLDELYNSLKKDTRYYIRKSEKEEYEFKIANNVNSMERFQDLKSESKKREGEKPFRNLPFWKKHWKIMKNNGFEELVTAEYKNKIAFVTVMAANNETGVIQPFQEVGLLCHQNNILFFKFIYNFLRIKTFNVK